MGSEAAITPEEARKRLCAEGLVAFRNLFSSEELRTINERLDHSFEGLHGVTRAYCTAPDLARLGLLSNFMNPKLLGLVKFLEPQAKFYHCHVYEIEAQKDAPHIHGGPNMGWHWDTDVPRALGSNGVPAFSVFVYLSEVRGQDDGAFEIAQKREDVLSNGIATYVLEGPQGTSFLWDRSFLHRANPNTSATRRRVFKISVHHQRRWNHFLFSRDFRRAAAMHEIPDDLRKMFRLRWHPPFDAQNDAPWMVPVAPKLSSVRLNVDGNTTAKQRRRYRIA